MSDYNQAKSIFESQGDRLDIANVDLNVGNLVCLRGEMMLGLQYFSDAYELYNEIDYQFGKGQILISIADIQRLQGHLDDARNNLTTALDIFQKYDCASYIAGANSGLATIDWGRNNFALAGQEFQKALEFSMRDGNVSVEASILLSIGDMESALNNFDQSRQYFENARALFQKIGDRHGEANVLMLSGQTEGLVGHTDLAGSGQGTTVERGKLPSHYLWNCAAAQQRSPTVSPCLCEKNPCSTFVHIWLKINELIPIFPV